MSAKLLVDGPGMWAIAVPLLPGKSVRIGRTADNDLPLNDRAVSSKHAEIVEKNDVWYVRDLGSSNGTFINNKKVSEQPLKDGDVIKFGRCDVVFFDGANKKQQKANDATTLDFQKDVTTLQQIVSSAKAAPEQLPDSIPSFIGSTKHIAAPRQEVGIDSNPNLTPSPTDASGPLIVPGAEERDGEGMTSKDLVWVAENLASVLAELMRLRGSDEEVLYQAVMQEIRRLLEADNGFLMLADPVTNRWVIRAWVGDSQQWTSYEKEHPVPLTVANKAYTTKQVVSNALGADKGVDASASMMMLQVNHYIAVPLLVGGRRRGVLYFDTRIPMKRFEVKHVRLIERIGGYVLQIESQ